MSYDGGVLAIRGTPARTDASVTVMRSLGMAGVLAMTMVFGGCGGDSDPQATETETVTSSPSGPEMVTPNIILYDDVPLEYLWHGEGGQCDSWNLVEEMFGEGEAPRTEVELLDESGTTIALVTLPDSGGSFTKREGCEWPVPFDEVPVHDFYEVVVTNTAGPVSVNLTLAELTEGIGVEL